MVVVARYKRTIRVTTLQIALSVDRSCATASSAEELMATIGAAFEVGDIESGQFLGYRTIQNIRK